MAAWSTTAALCGGLPMQRKRETHYRCDRKDCRDFDACAHTFAPGPVHEHFKFFVSTSEKRCAFFIEEEEF